MFRILIKLWIAFIPFLIFGLWHYFNITKRKGEVSADVLEKRRRYFFYTVTAAALLVIAMLVHFGLSEPAMEHPSNTYGEINAR